MDLRWKIITRQDEYIITINLIQLHAKVLAQKQYILPISQVQDSWSAVALQSVRSLK